MCVWPLQDFTKKWTTAGSKTVELGSSQRVLTKAFMLGYVPVVVLVDVQMMAYIEYSAGATVSAGSLSASLRAFAGIKAARLFIKPGQPPQWSQDVGIDAQPQVVNNLAPSISLRMGATLRIGAKFTVTVDGMPITIEPALRLDANADLRVDQSCKVAGTTSFKASVEARSGITLPSLVQLADSACTNAVNLLRGNELVKAHRALNKCVLESLNARREGLDPIKDAAAFCSRVRSEFLPEVKKVTSYFAPDWHPIGSPFYSKAWPVPAGPGCTGLGKVQDQVAAAFDFARDSPASVKRLSFATRGAEDGGGLQQGAGASRSNGTGTAGAGAGVAGSAADIHASTGGKAWCVADDDCAATFYCGAVHQSSTGVCQACRLPSLGIQSACALYNDHPMGIEACQARCGCVDAHQDGTPTDFAVDSANSTRGLTCGELKPACDSFVFGAEVQRTCPASCGQCTTADSAGTPSPGPAGMAAGTGVPAAANGGDDDSGSIGTAEVAIIVVVVTLALAALLAAVVCSPNPSQQACARQKLAAEELCKHQRETVEMANYHEIAAAAAVRDPTVMIRSEGVNYAVPVSSSFSQTARSPRARQGARGPAMAVAGQHGHLDTDV